VANQDVTGVLLVGGGSTRFGSPKALASLDGELLGERGYRVLSEAFERVMAVGKEGDALPLPFPVFDDGSDERAAIVGIAAALRLADTEVCAVLPTDMPFISAGLMRSLAEAVEGADAAVVQTGPLPGAYRRSALPVLERRIAAGELALREAVAELDHRILEASPQELKNVNTAEDLPGPS
jgi:molybdopterin-guanine dinucleotide biosynthesis protein A